MMLPTPVNSYITDSVSQVNTKVLGDAPAMAMGNLFISTSQALSNAAHNATAGQQQTNITAQAATTTGVTTLYSIDTATDAIGTRDILRVV
ncbi:MAG: RebB family R body protein [Bacteroidetes bacterium]|nr:RebB family R body protein [Bacteroidota bacterium]